MKILIVSDIHGRSLKDIEAVIAKERPDKTIVLGDFDTVDTIHEAMNLENLYNAEVVPGNHDEALYNNDSIGSENMEALNKDFDKLYDELSKDKPARNYVGKLLDNYYKEFDVKAKETSYKVLALHGALSTNTGYIAGARNDTIKELWNRLRTKKDHTWNFRRMKEKGVDIHLRGHDGVPEVAYGTDNGLRIKVRKVRPETEGPVRFAPGAMHTITTGDYVKGHYTIIDTAAPGEILPVVYFKKLE